MTWPSFFAASISAGVTGSAGGASAITRVENAAPARTAPVPFSTSRREIPGCFISSFPALVGEVGYTVALVFYSDAVGGVHRRQLFAAATPQVLLRGTGSSGFHPGLNQRTGLLLRTRRGAAAGTGDPGPADQGIFADVMDKIFDLASAIAGRVFELRANFGNRLALPRHLKRRKMPFRMARHTAGVEVRVLMADRTAHRRETVAVRAAGDRWLVQPAFVALPWTITGRVAVGATRMGQHLAKFGEHGRRARVRIGDRCKALRACQRRRRGGRGLRNGGTHEHGHRQRRDGD